jgi:hypothetical protein
MDERWHTDATAPSEMQTKRKGRAGRTKTAVLAALLLAAAAVPTAHAMTSRRNSMPLLKKKNLRMLLTSKNLNFTTWQWVVQIQQHNERKTSLQLM